MAELRESGPNSVPIQLTEDDLHEGDIEVVPGKPGEVLLDVTTADGRAMLLSLGAAEVAHLIHLLARELGRTEPLEGYELRD